MKNPVRVGPALPMGKIEYLLEFSAIIGIPEHAIEPLVDDEDSRNNETNFDRSYNQGTLFVTLIYNNFHIFSFTVNHYIV